jgi:hypothetical protein
MNINNKQVLSIAIAVLSVLAVATSQLTNIFGAGIANEIVAVAGLLNTVLSSVMAVMTSQGSLVRSVAAMDGVENIDVNRKANKTLANVVLDKNVDKVNAVQSDEAAIKKTAEGG